MRRLNKLVCENNGYKHRFMRILMIFEGSTMIIHNLQISVFNSYQHFAKSYRVGEVTYRLYILV